MTAGKGPCTLTSTGTQIRVRDIQWLERMADGLAAARVARKPVVLKPLGQGMGSLDEW